MTQVIVILLTVGVLYIGFVQVFLFMRKHYLGFRALCKELRLFLKSRREGNRIIEVKIRGQSPPKGNPETKQERVVEVPMPIIDSTSKEQPIEEPLYISLHINDVAYNSSETISADELVTMSRTLSGREATMADKIATVRTLCKLKDTPFMDEIDAAAGKRIREVFRQVREYAEQLEKTKD